MREFYQNKKVLITGHSGFKGAWLAKILLNWGAEVVGLSLPPNTYPNLFEILELEKKIKKNYFQDIRDYEKVLEIFKNEKPEIVFHLAAQPLVRDSYDDPLQTHTTNVIGTANVLQAIKDVGGVKSVVVITTDKVYENREKDYFYKETDALGGYDPYSASKAAADIVTNSYIQSFFNPKNYGDKHDTLMAVARAGNVIGGGDWGKDRLMTDLIRAVFEKKEAMIIRSPNAFRPWQHVLEPLRGYLMLGEKLYKGEKDKVGSWNFGPSEGNTVHVEEFVKRGLKILGQGEYKIVEDSEKHEANLLKLDINKAINDLGWVPGLALEDGLTMAFEWYSEYYKNGNSISDLTDKQIKEYFGE